MQAGPGRPKGLPNKTTAALKDMILKALESAGNDVEKDGGGAAYLAKQAKEQPAAFMTLLGKVLPMQVSGEGGGALIVRWQKETETPE